jgi:hypothetical protein
MSQELFNQQYINLQYWILVIQILTVVAASIFAIWQVLINKRLKELQDYVAVSMVPFFDGNDPKLQVINAGQINLYLKKFDIGTMTTNFEKERLLVCGSGNPFYILPVPNNIIGVEIPVKLYLIDEFKNKYISTGAVIIDAIPMAITGQPASPMAGIPLPPAQSPQQITFRTNIRGWSYKTEKINWTI